MKNLLLLLCLCFAFSSCFESEEDEIETEEELSVAEKALECEQVKTFIEWVNDNPPRETRATVKLYQIDNESVIETNTGIDSVEYYINFLNTDCQLICYVDKVGVVQGGDCTIPFLENIIYNDATIIETIWEDER